MRTVLNAIITVLFVLSVLGFSVGELRFISGDGPLLVSNVHWLICALSATLTWLFIWLSRVKQRMRDPEIEFDSPSITLYPLLIPLGLLVVFISDVPGRSFTFYTSASTAIHALYLGLAALLVFLLVRVRKPGVSLQSLLSPATLIFLQLLLAILFLRYAEGRLLFSDDHPSFLYRLQLLLEHFPFIPFYNVDWNAGYSAREFFPSGVLNVFVLSYPLLRWLTDISTIDGASSYTLLIPYLYMLIVPWSVYLAARVLNFNRNQASLAAILSLGPTLTYFEWLLKYGTLGFSLSAGLVPLTFAFAFRVGVDEKPSWRAVIGLVFASFLCLTWSLSAVVFIPLIVYALVRLVRNFSFSRLNKIVIFLLLFVALNGPSLYLLVQESRVLEFLTGNTLPGSTVTSIHQQKVAEEIVAEPMNSETFSGFVYNLSDLVAKVHEPLQFDLVKLNPLLLLFFVPGLLIFKSTLKRNSLLLTIFWLLCVAATGELFKPQLELRRMILPASFLMCLAASPGIIHALKSLERVITIRPIVRLPVAVLASVVSVVLLGAIFISPVTVGAAYQNRSDEKFVFAPPLLSNMANAISEHGGEGRTFFLGFILQDFGAAGYSTQDGGHVAVLPSFAGKPMYASNYYHRYWSSVDPIPESYRARGSNGYEEFLDLVHVTAVVVFKSEWERYCLDHPERYTRVFEEGRFQLFTRKTDSGYFAKGAGTVKTASEGFKLIPATQEAVLKFRYLPKLRVSPPHMAEIFPLKAFDEEIGGGKSREVQFIGIKVSKAALANNIELSVGYFPE